MKCKQTLVSLALMSGVMASGGVNAATFDLGVLGPVLDQEVIVGAGAFSDVINFSVEVYSDVATTALNNPLVKVGRTSTVVQRNIEGLTMSLFDTHGTASTADDTQIGSALASGEYSYDFLASGNYYAKVTGTATGTYGGKYTVTMSAEPAPVPVPAAAWLLGSGLLGLVAVSRRKVTA